MCVLSRVSRLHLLPTGSDDETPRRPGRGDVRGAVIAEEEEEDSSSSDDASEGDLEDTKQEGSVSDRLETMSESDEE